MPPIDLARDGRCCIRTRSPRSSEIHPSSTIRRLPTTSAAAKSVSPGTTARSASGSNSLAYRLTSALALSLVAVMGHGQAFGRFGYTEKPRQGGIQVDRSGFVALHPAADRFSFER